MVEYRSDVDFSVEIVHGLLQKDIISQFKYDLLTNNNCDTN